MPVVRRSSLCEWQALGCLAASSVQLLPSFLGDDVALWLTSDFDADELGDDESDKFIVLALTRRRRRRPFVINTPSASEGPPPLMARARAQTSTQSQSEGRTLFAICFVCFALYALRSHSLSLALPAEGGSLSARLVPLNLYRRWEGVSLSLCVCVFLNAPLARNVCRVEICFQFRLKLKALHLFFLFLSLSLAHRITH